MNLSIVKTAELLKTTDDVLILMHRNPDGDTIGCGFALWSALRKTGKKASVACCDSIPLMYDYLTTQYDNSFLDFDPKVYISVDSASLSQLGDISYLCDEIDISIDHHESNTKYAKHNLVESSYASCSEIVYEIIKLLDVKIDKYIASAIYTGVSTDTGCFKYRNTTVNCHIVAAELMDYGIDLGYLNRILFETRSKQLAMLQQMVLSSLKYFYNDKIAVATVTRNMMDISGASEDDMTNVSPIAKSIEGVEVGLTFRETLTGLIKCSVRTSSLVDANKISSIFGGGGHHGSAGFECSGSMLDVQTMAIQAAIKELELNAKNE